MNNTEENDRQRTIINEWQMFSKTNAYRDLMEYMQQQQDMLLGYAEEMQIPNPSKSKESPSMIPIDSERVNTLLQNRRGINIVRTYIRLRSE